MTAHVSLRGGVVALALIVASGAVAPTPASAAAQPVLATVGVPASSFADGAWIVRRGTAALRTVETESGSALQVSQQVGDDGVIELMPARNPPAIDDLPALLAVVTRGNPGGRTLYVQVQDATGEIFHFRVGRPHGDDWQTHEVDLAEPPAATLWGDRDGVLDLPVSVVKLVLDPPSTIAPQAFAFQIGDVRLVGDPWTVLAASPKAFTPSAGERTRLSFVAPVTGPFVVSLSDELGRTLTWRGSSTAGAVASRSWNGGGDDGGAMVGSIRARMTFGVEGERRRVDIPYVAGVLEHRPAADDSLVNVNTFLSEPDPSRRSFVEWQGRRLEEAGVAMARETFVWDRLEPRKGWFEWAKFDQAVEIAGAHGVDIVGVLGFSAAWASSAPGSVAPAERVLFPPTNVADYADYVRAVVRRYRDRVRTWEVWNEPNHPRFWRPGPNPEAYAALLAAASVAIRAEDPGATIVLGGIVGADVRYLDRLRAAGGWDDFDVLALHGYVRLSPEASGLGGWLDRAVAYVERYGRRPVWLTEICWPLDDGDQVAPAITPQTQAAYLSRTFIRAAEAGISRVFWYSLTEHPSSIASRYDRCGLFDGARRARPAFTALRTVAAAFDRAGVVGSADPAGGSRRAVDPRAYRWSTQSVSGGNGRASRAIDGIRVTYDLPTTGSALRATTDLPLPGRPTSIVVGLTGDGSANAVLAAFVDATGERCSGTLGPLMAGTRHYRMFLDGSVANWTCAGGDGDGRLDAPVRLRALTVNRTGIGDAAGTWTVRDIAIGEGPAVRGLVLASGRVQRLLLHHPPGAIVATVGVPASVARIIEGGTRRDVAVTGGKIPFGVGPVPRLLQFGVGASPSTIDPGGSTTLRWVGGDDASVRFQILDAAGRSVRIDSERTMTAGARTTVWNGRLSASRGVAPAGRWTVRLVFRARDGRIGYLTAPVTVR